MAARSRRGAFAPRQRKRAAPAWGFVGSIAAASIAPATKVLLGSFVLSNPPLGETVLRTRAQFHIRSDQSAVVEDQIGAFGLIVVTDIALAAGAASIPGPFTDGGDDGWFVHQPITQAGANLTAAGTSPWQMVDSKAMRKIEDGQGVAIMIENASAAFAFLEIFQVRVLAKLTES